MDSPILPRFILSFLLTVAGCDVHRFTPTKLGSVSRKTFTLVVPKNADIHNLVIGQARSGTSGEITFKGIVSMRSGREVFRFEFSSSTAKQGNWLSNQGQIAWIITPTNRLDFSRTLDTGLPITLEIECDVHPPQELTLWYFAVTK